MDVQAELDQIRDTQDDPIEQPAFLSGITFKESRIFLCQPTYGNAVHPDSSRCFWVGHSKPGGKAWNRCDMACLSRSLLANCFNHFWCEALNRQMDGDNIQYFGMLHSDIVADDGWLDILLEDLESSGADLVAAAVPIKDPEGKTSTAIEDPDDEFSVLRRITMHELHNGGLPPVFTAADCGYPDRLLLANTGCWLCRFDRPWRHATDENGDLLASFEIKDRIGRTPSGRYAARTAPEDWNFSRRIGKLGAKVVVTRRVNLRHVGDFPYPSDCAWGTFVYDVPYGAKFGNVPIGKSHDADYKNGNGSDRQGIARELARPVGVAA